MLRYCLLFICIFSALYADDYLDAEFEIPSPPPFYPISFSGDYVGVNPATFYTPSVEGQQLTYAEYNAAFSLTFPLAEDYGLIFGSGWVGSELDWAENPDFTETTFNYVSLMFGGFTKAFPRWLWSGTIAIFMDTQRFSLADYALYQGVLYGHFEWFPCLELNVGCIIEVGLNKEKAWPLIGFVYRPTDRLVMKAVFPVDVGIEYNLFKQWVASGRLRFLRNRHRVGEDEMRPQSIFEYHTWGAEFNLKFSPLSRITVAGFAGSTFQGDLKITNRNNLDPSFYKFNSSFYAGGSGKLSF